MSTSLSRRRSALAVASLLFLVILLAFATNSWAGTMTYDIVDYPADETDLIYSGTDAISGTIITDGNMGQITPNDIVGGTLILTTPGGTFSATNFGSGSSLSSVLTATPTQLTISSPSYIYLDGLNATATDFLSFGWNPDADVFLGLEATYPGNVTLAGFRDDAPTSAPGSIAANNTWIIATVPDPPPARSWVRHYWDLA